MSTTWYLHRQGETKGPLSPQQLRALAAEGSVSPEDWVFREGTDDWQSAGEIPGLLPDSKSSQSVAESTSPRETHFDPYLKWLGIHPPDQPPTHYRLLGIDLFEADADVIDTAANRQMNYLHGCTTGQHAALAEKLLNEISAARLCLLDAHAKADYDVSLRSAMGPTESTAINSAPVDGSITASALATTPPRLKRTQVRHRGQRSSVWVEVLKTLLVSGIFLGATAYLLRDRFDRSNSNGSNDPAVATVPSPGNQARDASTDSTDRPVMDSAASNFQRQLPPNLPSAAVSEETSNAAVATGPIDAASTPQDGSMTAEDATSTPNSDAMNDLDLTTSIAAINTETSSGVPIPSMSGDETHLGGTFDGIPPPMGSGNLAELLTPMGSKASLETRHPVPNEQQTSEAIQKVTQTFASEIAKANSVLTQSAFAKRLINLATQNPAPLEQYALLLEAKIQAERAGNLLVAAQAIDEMAALFQVDALEEKTRSFERVDPLARTSYQQHRYAIIGFEIGKQLIELDDYTRCDNILKSALGAAVKSRDDEAAKAINVLVERASSLREQYEAIEPSRMALSDSEKIAPASTVIGKFDCFAKGQWDRGLPMLAQGDDANLAKLAQTELERPIDVASMMAVADQWWSIAEAIDNEPHAEEIRTHAADWYESALPRATGLDQQRANARLKMHRAEPQAEPPGPAPSNTAATLVRHHPCGATNRVTLLTNGQIHAPGVTTWLLHDGLLILIYPRPGTAGEINFDFCELGPGGTTYTGQNDLGHTFFGEIENAFRHWRTIMFSKPLPTQHHQSPVLKIRHKVDGGSWQEHLLLGSGRVDASDSSQRWLLMPNHLVLIDPDECLRIGLFPLRGGKRLIGKSQTGERCEVQVDDRNPQLIQEMTSLNQRRRPR